MHSVDCILVIQNPLSNIWAIQLIAEDVLKIGSLWSGLVKLARARENFGHDWTTF